MGESTFRTTSLYRRALTLAIEEVHINIQRQSSQKINALTHVIVGPQNGGLEGTDTDINQEVWDEMVTGLV